MAEVVQAAGGIESSALVQVEPSESAATRLDVPVLIQHRHAAEGVVGVTLDDVARIVKDRGDIIVGVLGHPQAFIEAAVAVPITQPISLNPGRSLNSKMPVISTHKIPVGTFRSRGAVVPPFGSELGRWQERLDQDRKFIRDDLLDRRTSPRVL